MSSETTQRVVSARHLPRVRPDRRPRLLVAGLVILTASALVAFRQAYRPDPLTPVRAWRSLDWWRYPLETNGFRRVAGVDVTLNAVTVPPGSEDVWVVGDRGYVARSGDGGRTWQQIGRGEAPQEPTLDASWSLVRSAHADPPEPPRRKLDEVSPPRRDQNSDSKTPDGVASEVPPPPPPPPRYKTQKAVRKAPATKRAPQRTTDRTAPTTTLPEKPAAGPTPETTQGSNEFPSVDLYTVSFADRDNGWVAGADGVIVRIRRQGDEWTWGRQSSATTGDVRAIFVLRDGLRGWAVGERGLLKTTDGGASWTSTSTPDPFFEVHSLRMSSDGQRGSFTNSDGTYRTVDGGDRWQRIDTPFAVLASFFLDDGVRGWAVGANGRAATTSDGGKSWNARDTGIDSRLRAVSFSEDGLHGWAAGDDGLIIATGDGGATWQPRSTSLQRTIHSIGAIASGERIWAVGEVGLILHSSDSGTSWQLQSGLGILSVCLTTNGKGWAVGGDGLILATHDAGESWLSQRFGRERALRGISALPDGSQAWVVGTEGTILTTLDDGTSWNVQSSETERDLNDIVTLSDGRAWIVGDEGTVLTSRDRGASWFGRETGTDALLFDVDVLADGATVVAAGGSPLGGDRGEILKSRDGGATWTAIAHPSLNSDAIASIEFSSDGRHGLALQVGTRGSRQLHTRDGGDTWEADAPQSADFLLSVSLQRDGSASTVGAGGRAFRSLDAGNTWQVAPTGSNAMLYSTAFDATGKHGVAVGMGAILTTDDGGASWTPVRHIHRGPAPWFWLVTALLVVPLFVGAFRRPVEPPPVKSIADILLSDRPIENRGEDRLGSTRLATVLSDFVANTSTVPPLSVAITGDWGSGKSSLMNLVRSGLREYGFRTVWFNAWHHQSEEHFLSSLFEAIRRQGVPKWWTASGIMFYWRLLALRGLRWWAPLLCLTLVGGLVLSFAGVSPSRLGQLSDMLSRLAKGEASFGGVGLAKALLVLGPLVGFVATLWRLLDTFGVSATSVTSAFTGRMHVDRLNADPGVRHQFSESLSDVTRALGDRGLVIFIDDLDRCSPQNVTMVLELVNFLMSSNCYVVLGMARRWVEGCVGLAFKDVAVQLTQANDAEPPKKKGDEKAAEESDSDQAERLRGFARQYLDKLINIEAAIAPLPTSEAVKLVRDGERPNGKKRSKDRLTQTALAGGWLLALCAGITLGVQLRPTVKQEAPRPKPPESDHVSAMYGLARGYLDALTSVELPKSGDADPETASRLLGLAPAISEAIELGQHVKNATPTPTTVVTSTSLPSTAGPSKADGALPPALLEPAHAAGVSSWWLTACALAIALLLGGGITWLRYRPKPLVHDTDEFREALDVWLPLVFVRSPTPRAMKRFVNRVRFLATMAGSASSTPAPTAAEATPPAQTAAGPLIPDAVLVMLSAIQHARPDWLTQKFFWANPMKFLEDTDLRSILGAPEPDQGGLARVRQQLARYPTLESFLQNFFRLTSTNVTIR